MSYNYMDNVPVKIAEKYRPPPRIFQLPQTVLNKLQLPEQHYEESPQFAYDFQLEQKVLTKIPVWRRMRETEREARQARREKREQERLRRIEEQHKQMLGAVSYPNAEELSSSDDENEKEKLGGEEQVTAGESPAEAVTTPIATIREANWIATQNDCFNNILQPTVLVAADNSSNVTSTGVAANAEQTQLKSNLKPGLSGVVNSNKLANTFNYKDFEEDTSSPFDNIELKTINDLDILAQVLHNTQLKANSAATAAAAVDEELEDSSGSNSDGGATTAIEETKEKSESEETTSATSPMEVLSDMTTLEHTKAALEKVEFGDINLEYDVQNSIPAVTTITTATYIPPAPCYTVPVGHHYTNGLQQQQQQDNVYQNQNYLYSPNGLITSYTHAPLHQHPHQQQQQKIHYIGNNANNYLLATNYGSGGATAHQHALMPQQLLTLQEAEAQTTKSKSVPDILRELSDEVRNSKMRRQRQRNLSYNSNENKEHDDDVEDNDGDDEVGRQQQQEAANKLASTNSHYASLTAPAQHLAKNISSMGFPLERVAKITQLYGTDDKKIVEHLIPLSELLDLGFDETRISEALLKFDNNKEKALEYLIT